MKSSVRLSAIFTIVLIPYFVFVLWLASRGPQWIDSLSRWPRLAMLAYFVGSILILSAAIKHSRKHKESAMPTGPGTISRNLRLHRSSKKLLIIYLVAVPVGVISALAQKDIPVRFALLGLTVPLLMIGVLWKVLSRSKADAGPR
jgi:hypothetical protein